MKNVKLIVFKDRHTNIIIMKAKGVYENNIKDGIGTIIFDNGDTYVGSLYKGKQQGKGKYTFSILKDVYEGDFENNKFHGTGTYLMSCNSIYEGQFSEGKCCGYGKFKSTLLKHTGMWNNNQANGDGILEKNGNVIKCNFINGYANGYGTINYNNGDFYEGNIKNNLKYGNGVLITKSGKSVGNFDNIYFSGTKYYTNSNKYEGNLINDLRDGLGTLYFSDGRKYSGNFSNNKIKGFGTYTTCDGVQYEGTWLGLQNCQELKPL